MNHEQFQELKESYALGALSEDERREVEEYLQQNPAEQAEVDELASVASLMALAPTEQEPPEQLRKSLMKQVRSESGDASVENGSAESVSSKIGEWMARLFGFRGVAAGVAVLALVALLVWNVTLQTEVRELRDFQMSTYDLQGSGEASGAQGQVVNLDGERSMLVATDLPELPEGQTYEMWTIDEDEPESCGLFESGEGLSIESIDQSLTGAETFAITVEPEGGSPQPTGEPVVTADLRSIA